ncbi:MAG: hypothetical protein AAF517_05820 [Planctomycetota bacterium]
MSDPTPPKPKKLLRAFLWLVGLASLSTGAWLTWYRVTENLLIQQLEAFRAEAWVYDQEWMDVADELIAHRSRRGVRTILALMLLYGDEPRDDPLVDRLCETFGSQYVWRESVSAFEAEVRSREDEWISLVGFWIQDPSSRELAQLAERLVRSNRPASVRLACRLIPLVVSIPRERKVDLLLDLLARESRLNGDALEALEVVGLGKREEKFLRLAAKPEQRSRSMRFERLVEETEDGELRWFLWKVQRSQFGDATPRFEGQIDRSLIDNALRRGGWLEEQVRQETTEVSGRVLSKLRRRGWLNDERLLELIDFIERWS